MEGSEDRARGTTIVFIINDKPYFCIVYHLYNLVLP